MFFKRIFNFCSFICVLCFCLVVFLPFLCFLVPCIIFLRVKSYHEKKNKKFETVLITSFILLLTCKPTLLIYAKYMHSIKNYQELRSFIRFAVKLTRNTFRYFTRLFSKKWLLLYPAGIYLFNVSNRNTRKRCEICSKLTIKTPERRQFLIPSTNIRKHQKAFFQRQLYRGLIPWG